jgi:hypothetical protein
MDRVCSLVVEDVLCMYEVLGSIPKTKKENTKCEEMFANLIWYPESRI